jgi:hypothetical protein
MPVPGSPGFTDKGGPGRSPGLLVLYRGLKRPDRLKLWSYLYLRTNTQTHAKPLESLTSLCVFPPF